MRRGEIWWANLPSPSGSGPGLRRPVVVIQSNAFNDSRISTVIVLVITSNLALSAAPGNVRINKSASGLSRTSVINVSQVLTLDRAYLSERVKTLPGKVLENLNSGLRLSLGLN
jgi:mRNA interferase MazF